MDPLGEARPRLEALVAAFIEDSRARAALLCDRRGRRLACAGDLGGVDLERPGSWIAGSVRASNQPGPEDEFHGVCHGLMGVSLHVGLVARRALLCVFYDRRTTWGRVELRRRLLMPALEVLIESSAGHLEIITLDDLDRLFA
ncbi:MAG: hypothetical protein H6711_02075 [Myxococcales bacterium]|nr:hypothetical protein [Myxococcales bacterium]